MKKEIGFVKSTKLRFVLRKMNFSALSDERQIILLSYAAEAALNNLSFELMCYIMGLLKTVCEMCPFSSGAQNTIGPPLKCENIDLTYALIYSGMPGTYDVKTYLARK